MSFTEDLGEIVEKNVNGLLGIHGAWERVPLGEVASILNGFPFESKFFTREEGAPLLRIRDILSQTTDIKYRGPIPNGFWVESGDLLVGMDGDFNCARWRGDPALINQRVCKISVNEEFYSGSFLFRALGGYLSAVNANTSSTTVKHLSSKTISELPLPLPPKAEQTRIAQKLDTLLARVESCLEQLDRVPQILKRFREAVLEAAVSGRLTEEWRGEKDVLSEWQKTTFGLSGDVSGGLTKNSKRAALKLQRPYLRVANVYGNRLELDDVSTIGLTDSEWQKTKLIPGDLLIVEGNGSLDQIGRAARWNGELPECCHQNHLIRWRSLGSVDSRFALLWLMSPIGRQALMEQASTSAGLYTLSISKVSRVPLNEPSAAEQTEIVRRVGELFALADSLDSRYQCAMARLERLTPSVLAKAFRGELVPQDPSDEPAEQLLRRIRGEKETGKEESGKAKGGRRGAARR